MLIPKNMGWCVCLLATTLLFLQGPAIAQNSHPYCESLDSDSDGDGWGWENFKSCVIRNGSSDKGAGTTTSPQQFPACASAGSDPDGDGYGFENGRSCLAPEPSTGAANSGLPECQTNSDPDGDGYGWEDGRSCVVPESSDGSAGKEAGGEVSIAEITDVVVVTGQSNLLASHTKFDSVLDQPAAGVFAYTDQGWQIADLHQVWDIHAHPGNHSLVNPDNQPYNNLAMHFGKTMVQEDPSRVVAFIIASAPGKGIAHWDKGSSFYNFVANKVETALKEIPHKYSVDGILWQQGENDWLYEGTSDAGATGFASKESYEYINYYKIKLESLISNFRGESWGRGDSVFICGETRRAKGVNRRLMALNTDADQLTACVPATDLPKREDDPYGSHFSAEGLRELGKRFANKYLEINGG